MGQEKKRNTRWSNAGGTFRKNLNKEHAQHAASELTADLHPWPEVKRRVVSLRCFAYPAWTNM